MVIEIATAEDLYNIRNDLSGDYVLVNDIDLEGSPYNDPWEPIWDAGDWVFFTGSFDGQGHTISNLKIILDDTNWASENFYQGLFGYLGMGAVIKNLAVINAEVHGCYYVGIIAGGIDYGVIIENVHADGEVYARTDWGAEEIGGFAGFICIGTEGYIKNCSSTATVYGEGDDIGGFAGYIYGYYEPGGYIGIEKCYASGTIISNTGETVGGFVGLIGDDLGYVGDDFTGTGGYIKNCYSRVDVSGNAYVGGFAGDVYCSLIIENCYSAGTVNGNEYVGGFAGEDVRGVIKNCYSRTDVSGNADVGGFAGYVCYVSGSLIIENCYSAGTVNANEYVGGFAGENEEGVISSCYYDSEVSGQSDTGKGEPKTTAEMKQQSTYVGWDFVNVWGISSSINDGYPYLSVFVPEPPEPEEPSEEPSKLLYFLEAPRVSIQKPSANVVTVASPTDEYTAQLPGLSNDEKVERIVEIDEGNQEVCRIVAEELLSRWSREQKSISGNVQLCQGLKFEKKVRIYNKEAMIDEDMVIQKLEHDIINQETRVTAGDIILNDEELLARILENMSS